LITAPTKSCNQTNQWQERGRVIFIRLVPHAGSRHYTAEGKPPGSGLLSKLTGLVDKELCRVAKIDSDKAVFHGHYVAIESEPTIART